MTHEELQQLAPGFYWISSRTKERTVAEVKKGPKFPENHMWLIGAQRPVENLTPITVLEQIEPPAIPRPPMRKATIEVLVEAEGEEEACDVLNEALRPLLKKYAPGSGIVDWRYSELDVDTRGDSWREHDGTGFELD